MLQTPFRARWANLQQVRIDCYVSFVKVVSDQEVVEALEWQFARTPEQVNQEREHLIKWIENAGESMWNIGKWIC